MSRFYGEDEMSSSSSSVLHMVLCYGGRSPIEFPLVRLVSVNTHMPNLFSCNLFVMYKLLLLALLFSCGTDAMTRQQLKNSGKLMKKTCMPKNDVTEDQVGEIEKGKFIEERNVMCYIACIYQMSQIVSAERIGYVKDVMKVMKLEGIVMVKNNKLNYDATIKQVDLLYPPDMKEAVKAAITKCRDVCEYDPVSSA
ncbi:General odorant-binding protein 72 [Eumeta japonica]|uniref:General odorant-binding protein 72 n=1 Tax=Eumeta variegata TaxID=151549 RepID=A0A4C1V003_EUMVA|nr:General odorant-binding protein 72 [Eumeta japonica]